MIRLNLLALDIIIFLFEAPSYMPFHLSKLSSPPFLVSLV